MYPHPAGLVIATKGGLERTGPGKWQPRGNPAYLRRELEGSLQRLRPELVDLYQLHRIDPQLDEDEQFEVIAEFQRAGLVRHIGLSEASVQQIHRAQHALPTARDAVPAGHALRVP